MLLYKFDECMMHPFSKWVHFNCHYLYENTIIKYKKGGIRGGSDIIREDSGYASDFIWFTKRSNRGIWV